MNSLGNVLTQLSLAKLIAPGTAARGLPIECIPTSLVRVRAHLKAQLSGLEEQESEKRLPLLLRALLKLRARLAGVRDGDPCVVRRDIL
jgi:hypothetical protein